MSIIEKALGSTAGDKKHSGKSGEELGRSVKSTAIPALLKRDSAITAGLDIDPRANGVGRDSPTVLSGSSTESSGETQGSPGGLDSLGKPKPFIKVPLEDLDASGFLTPLKPRSAIGEEFRGIKRPLLRNCSSRGSVAIPHANLIMVTSALQGDGKTFCSLNLALSIASEQDKTVLYVDADVLKGTACRTLGVPDDTPGLIDLLEGGELTPQDVILRTSIPKLRVLPAGRRSPHATELLASESMHQMMLEFSERYHDRIIIFDSPPLLLTTEASVLASFMGQIVFVASAEKTPTSAVKQALEYLGEGMMVGMVMNRASRNFNPFGYGYGYGYNYGDGEGESDGKTAG